MIFIVEAWSQSAQTNNARLLAVAAAAALFEAHAVHVMVWRVGPVHGH